ncbi:phenylacetate--CoA ligase family protein [Macrococcoides canis]|uniref:phenylacetate--CoA ligase family protein n=1 Tax=Macrococcoides canis TaxID=1855823 RepID=UPI0010D3676C|nr:phenylacetate--CoA ligase family protein [Macrococcus canis]TDM20843.1 phenylacetate--CoA ligase family protein [Macrococcus canis]
MRKIIFYLGYIIGSQRVLKNFNKSIKMRTYSEQKVKEYQFNKLKNYLIDAYEQTVYYKEIFDKVNFNPYEFSDLKEMKKIPLLNKSIINSRKHDFYSNKNHAYKISKSGGSTGEPFEFRLGLEDAAWSRALLFNGFNYAGYKFGDKILTIAGGSLVNKNSTVKQKLMNYVLNNSTIGTLILDERNYNIIINKINKERPKFIRGYASSIYLVSKYIDDHNLKIYRYPNAIFTTSETLEDYQRKLIEEVFKCKVFDQYGLNDSGASAFQYDENKYLIDYERSYIEFIEDDFNHRIISTSYSNDALYFIRYDTGDNIILENEKKFNKLVASKILGRASESLSINNIDISVPRLTILLAELSAERYQIIKNENKLQFKYTGLLTKKDEEFVQDLFQGFYGDISIEFIKIDNKDFLLTKNGKHKYIVDIKE